MPKSNRQSLRKGQEVAHRLRVGLGQALHILADRKSNKVGRKVGIDEVIADWLEDDPQGTLNALSKYFPKDASIDVNVAHTFEHYLQRVGTVGGEISDQAGGISRLPAQVRDGGAEGAAGRLAGAIIDVIGDEEENDDS